MTNLTVKSALAALLVSVPLAGAFAENNADYVNQIDRMSTSSINGSQTRGLTTQRGAAQSNLDALGRSSSETLSIQAEINAVKAAAASGASAQSLASQLHGINQQIGSMATRKAADPTSPREAAFRSGLSNFPIPFSAN